MSIADQSVAETGPSGLTGKAFHMRSILLLFAATLFVSALLVFSVQPLFAKMVLPKLGGSPSVWSVAMVFFQAVLLAGYAYAHLLTRYLAPKTALIVHGVVLLIGFLALPLAVATGWGNPPETGQAFWLLGLFGASVGLPFFAVTANGPLMQAWFARTDHPHASDPYFLYGASNIGSFAALLSYPILFEPLFSLGEQAWMWSVGFATLAALIILCGLTVVRKGNAEAAVDQADALSEEKPSLGTRAKWVGLAFVPSALLVAVTQHISTDVAAAPFLWVVPLSLFLLTFVITFQRQPILKHAWMSFLLPLLAGPVLVSLFFSPDGPISGLVTIFLHFAMLFVSAMVCHGELVKRRPAASHLTEFYLWMSFGGVLGGIFTGLLAPALFSTVLEYPILIILVFFCRSELYASGAKPNVRHMAVASFAAAALMLAFSLDWSFSKDDESIFRVMLIGLAALIMLCREKPAIHVSLVAFALAGAGITNPGFGSVEFHRSFFGVSKIAETDDGQYRLLFSGTTLHGAERIRNADGTPYESRPVPTTYYYPTSPLVRGLEAIRAARTAPLEVAAVGLGSGSLACSKAPNENWKYFEIDRVVIDIARDPSKFRFLEECSKNMPIVVGDARLTLGDEPAKKYDLLILDAFSSDAIPVHLITTQAMDLYFSKLKDDGVLLLHISNRHVELASVVAATAGVDQRVTYGLALRPPKVAEGVRSFDSPSEVAIVANRVEDLGEIPAKGFWSRVDVRKNVAPWSDDYSNILAAIHRNYTESRNVRNQ